MSNRLIAETSPYLRQHAENPVDWFPWGDEPFEKARAEDKPVFLSVGYSACHWCHVMEHESFENEETAEFLNEHFVSVKVDREERPDVDAIYMDVLQALTGNGGWPMSVFLDTGAAPFYAGTYFPDKARHGSPSFLDVLKQIAGLWETRRDELLDVGMSLKNELLRQASVGAAEGGQGPLEEGALTAAMDALAKSFDRENGGWGRAPKFPQPAVIDFVLRRYLASGDEAHLEMATRTLDAMMRGGINDQLGGGFHRYATDDIWLVPHFEKMLYDNAQLARVYLHAWQVTGDEAYKRVVTETLDFLAREMRDPAGGFYSAQDADSEGVEGRFYVWTAKEVRATAAIEPGLSATDAELFMEVHGVTSRGNFEGSNILVAARTAEQVAADHGMSAADVETSLASVGEALALVRERRVKPGLDDKVLTSWNGLALAAFAEAARVLGRDDYLAIAEKNAKFVLSTMRNADGRMGRTWRAGKARLNGYLEDYTHYADGLLELYQTTFEPRWFVAARGLADSVLAHFADPRGGFFDVSDDHEALIVRPKGLHDGATPSGGAMAAGVLAKIAAFTGEGRYADASEAAMSQVQETMRLVPLGYAQWLAALDFTLAPPTEVAIVGEDPEALIGVVRAQWRPNAVVAADYGDVSRGEIALLEGRESVGGHAAAYVCRKHGCLAPVTDPGDLDRLLG